jgi:hypothetical protein
MDTNALASVGNCCVTMGTYAGSLAVNPVALVIIK